MAQLVVTQKGLEKLRQELDELKNIKRPEVVARIARAKEYGDLSENAEYADARDEQAFMEGRIQELEAIVRRAVVSNHKAGSVQVEVGSIVAVQNNGDAMNFEIVGVNESDPATGKISADSPLGSALLGKAAGDKVTVPTPDGETVYTIKKVS